MKISLHSGSLKLLGFILRRERLSLLVWIAIITAFSVMIPSTLGDMYKTDIERQTLAITMQSPAVVSMMGPVYGAEHYTTGAMMHNMMLMFSAVAACIMNVFLVVRSTRRDEEEGRAEVIRSLPVGRLAILSGTMLTALIANAALALITGIGMAIPGIEGMGPLPCLLYGAALGCAGLVTAAFTTLLCQLTSNARSATAYSIAFLGVMYLLRAAGDGRSEALALISPLGLLYRTAAFTENRWWPIPVSLLITAAATAAAFRLGSIRDLGDGLIKARPGRRTAPRTLCGTFGLSLRLLRGSMIAWTVALLILSASYGSIMGDLEEWLNGNELLKAAFAGDDAVPISQQFLATIMSVMSIVVSVPVISCVFRLRTEERAGRLEHILARAVPRTRLIAGYAALSLASGVLICFASGIGFWASASAVMSDPLSLPMCLGAQLAYLPAIWILSGLSLVLVAYLPMRIGVIWAYLGYSFVAVYLAKLAGLPEWLDKLTPFGLTPQYPVADLDWARLGLLTVAAAALVAFGIGGYVRRDMRM